MKHIITHPMESAVTMFFAIIATLIFWADFRPEIKEILRTAQGYLFWWQ